MLYTLLLFFFENELTKVVIVEPFGLVLDYLHCGIKVVNEYFLSKFS